MTQVKDSKVIYLEMGCTHTHIQKNRTNLDILKVSKELPNISVNYDTIGFDKSIFHFYNYF